MREATECILCGTDPPLTDEHVWPRWYRKLLNDSMADAGAGARDRPAARHPAGRGSQPDSRDDSSSATGSSGPRLPSSTGFASTSHR